MMMMSFVSIGVVSMLWVPTAATRVHLRRRDGRSSAAFGDFGLVGLETVAIADAAAASPQLAFVAFQATFAIITVALISGADRRPRQVRRLARLHRPLGDARLLPGRALGLVASAASDGGKAGWIVAARRPRLRRRHGGPHQRRYRRPGAGAGPRQAASAGAKDPMRPHNLPLVMLGAGLLWFGWFGFNAGSALGRRRHRRAWPSSTRHRGDLRRRRSAGSLVERLRDGTSTTLGAASGAVAGLVAITPACALVDPARRDPDRRRRRRRVRLRGRPEVQVRLRRLARRRRRPPGRRLVGHPAHRLLRHRPPSTPAAPTGCSTAAARRPARQAGARPSLAVARPTRSSSTSIIGKLIDMTMGFRVTEEDEVDGIDLAVHAETAYDFGTSGRAARARLGGSLAPAAATRRSPKAEQEGGA